MDGLRIEIDDRAMQEIVERVGATPQQAKAAAARAFTALQRRIHDAARTKAAHKLGIDKKHVTRRFRKNRASEAGLQIWVGTYRMKADKLGRPRETKTGVNIGRRKFPGAFVWGARGFVMIRSSSKFIAAYPGLKSTPGRGPYGKKWPRYPIQRVTIGISKEVEASFQGSEAENEAFFMKKFEVFLLTDYRGKGGRKR